MEKKYDIDETKETVLVDGPRFCELLGWIRAGVEHACCGEDLVNIRGGLCIGLDNWLGDIEGKEAGDLDPDEDGNVVFYFSISEYGLPAYLRFRMQVEESECGYKTQILQDDSKEKGYDLISIDGFDVVTKAERIYLNPDCSNMFGEGSGLGSGGNRYIDIDSTSKELLEKLDGRLVENAFCMFCYCSRLSSVPRIKGFDSGALKNINSMFEDCRNLENIDAVKDWNVSNVEDMDDLFFACKYIKDFDAVKNWDITNVKEDAIDWRIKEAIKQKQKKSRGR